MITFAEIRSQSSSHCCQCELHAIACMQAVNRHPNRAVLTGIVFALRSGIAWNLLPQELGCGSGTACWRRLIAWQEAGVRQRIHETLLAELHRRGQLDMARAIVDSSSVRAMRAGKTAGRKGFA